MPFEEDAHEEFPLAPSKASMLEWKMHPPVTMDEWKFMGRPCQEFFSSKDSDCFQLAEDAGTL